MVSGKLIGHVENCYRPPTRRLSQGLDRALGIPEFFEGMYAAIKRESGPTSSFWEYAEYEGLACSIKCYENFLVTGLLQTEEYARRIVRAGQRREHVEQLVTTRMDRQEILRREDPPWLTVLLDQSIVRRVVGDREVMRGQLEHLRSMMEEPRVTVRIVPDEAPIYPSGSLVILDFTDRSPVAYVEGIGGHGQIVEDTAQVSALDILFDQIGAVALPVADSEKLIQAALEGL